MYNCTPWASGSRLQKLGNTSRTSSTWRKRAPRSRSSGEACATSSRPTGRWLARAVDVGHPGSRLPMRRSRQARGLGTWRPKGFAFETRGDESRDLARHTRAALAGDRPPSRASSRETGGKAARLAGQPPRDFGPHRDRSNSPAWTCASLVARRGRPLERRRAAGEGLVRGGQPAFVDARPLRPADRSACAGPSLSAGHGRCHASRAPGAVSDDRALTLHPATYGSTCS
jgi:hypothetical protein